MMTVHDTEELTLLQRLGIDDDDDDSKVYPNNYTVRGNKLTENTVNDLIKLLPTYIMVESLSVEGKTPKICRAVWRKLFEAVLCHPSISYLCFHNRILDISKTHELVKVIRCNTCNVVQLLYF